MFLVIALVIIAVFSIVEGVLLAQLWDWFVVPLGVKALTTAHAIGITLIVSMLTHQHISRRTMTPTLRTAASSPRAYCCTSGPSATSPTAS